MLRQEAKQPEWGASLVALRPEGDRLPFFCVPGNLGNVFTDLGPLARNLGPDQPFYGLQDTLENPAKIEALAGHYLDHIRAVQPQGPYLLGGICSGGVVAFEMARQLQAQGQQIALLAMIEPTRPSLPGWRPYFNLMTYLAGRISRRFSRHLKNYLQRDVIEQQAYVGLKKKLLSNMWAVTRYLVQPYPGRIKLFLTEESLAKAAQNQRLAWRELATGGVDVLQIPGTHNSITGNNDTEINEAHMAALAEQLQACLLEAGQNL
jgi:thioesterase domain-containing protein